MPYRLKQVRNLMYEQKQKICQWHHANAALTQSQLADRANHELGLLKVIVEKTISCILRSHQKSLYVMVLDSKVSEHKFSHSCSR